MMRSPRKTNKQTKKFGTTCKIAEVYAHLFSKSDGYFQMYLIIRFYSNESGFKVKRCYLVSPMLISGAISNQTSML